MATWLYVHGFVRNGARTVRQDRPYLHCRTASSKASFPYRAAASRSVPLPPPARPTASFPTLKKGKADYERAFQTPAARTTGKHFARRQGRQPQKCQRCAAGRSWRHAGSQKLTMRPLREMDLPALDFGMTNVTAEGEGGTFPAARHTLHGKGSHRPVEVRRPHSERLHRRRHPYLLF